MKKLWKKLKKIRINKLFYNNKFVAIISVLISLLVWVFISSSSSQTTVLTVSDIPVEIPLSESASINGLQIFTGNDVKAKVDVSGNRLIVGQVTKSDIQIMAVQSSSTIVTPGNYTLELTAKKIGVLTDYEIISAVQPSFVTVMVDRVRSTEFTIEPQVAFNPKADYFVGSTVLSQQKVTVSGPESEVNKIKKVVAKSEIPGVVGSPTTVSVPLMLYDAYDKPIASETITMSAKEIEVTVPVLMKKTLDVTAEFENVPENIKFIKNTMKVTPKTLEIAGPEGILKDIGALVLTNVDFNEVSLEKNKFKVDVVLPQGCKNLNEINEAEITLNTSNLREKTLPISEFVFKNLPQGKTAKVLSGEITVKILIPYLKIGNIKSTDITAELDLEGKGDLKGTAEIPVKFSVKGFSDAWVLGKHFVNVQID